MAKWFNSRAALIALSTITVLLISNVVSDTVNTREYSENFPAVVCPAAPNGITSSISSPSVHTPFHQVHGKSLRNKEIGALRYTAGATAIVMDAQATTPVIWQSRTGAWSGSSPCVAPQLSQWFVGGTSDISSRGSLQIVNSGLSSALVDIFTWSEKGEEPGKVITIAANTSMSMRLDSLAPGAVRITVHVVPRFGRVNAFMIDERGKGLKGLGGDLVNSVSDARTTVVIPAIPQKVMTTKSSRSRKSTVSTSSHILRVLNPSAIEAHMTVEVISSDGIFSPVGFASRTVAPATVSDFVFDPQVSNGFFAVRITSDQPIVAAVQTSKVNGNQDFVWNTAADQLSEFSVATTGLAPTLVFVGDNISLAIRALFTNGKSKTFKVRGSDLATWTTPANTRSLTFQQVGRGISAGALQLSASGIGYFPLLPGSTLTRSSIPSSNIRVLNP